MHHLWKQQQKGMVIDSLLLHILRSACDMTTTMSILLCATFFTYS